MSARKCPFGAVQAAGAGRCRNAQEVVRRGGVEYDCTDATAHEACTSLVQHLNLVALPALGYEDDLTKTPKSVYDRVLIGGLQGLRMALDTHDDAVETADIWATVDAARTRYSRVDKIPAHDFVPAIESCRPPRRRRRP